MGDIFKCGDIRIRFRGMVSSAKFSYFDPYDFPQSISDFKWTRPSVYIFWYVCMHSFFLLAPKTTYAILAEFNKARQSFLLMLIGAIGHTKLSQVLLHLIFPTQRRSSSSATTTRHGTRSNTFRAGALVSIRTTWLSHVAAGSLFAALCLCRRKGSYSSSFHRLRYSPFATCKGPKISAASFSQTLQASLHRIL